jgi:hypothetical protein
MGLTRSGTVYSARSSDEMKSRVSIILALLLVFSTGLMEPLHAAERATTQTSGSDREFCGPPVGGGDHGDTGETQGDPDGWLGGQNLRPAPPLVNDLEAAPQSPDRFWAVLIALIQVFLIF